MKVLVLLFFHFSLPVFSVVIYASVPITRAGSALTKLLESPLIRNISNTRREHMLTSLQEFMLSTEFTNLCIASCPSLRAKIAASRVEQLKYELGDRLYNDVEQLKYKLVYNFRVEILRDIDSEEFKGLVEEVLTLRTRLNTDDGMVDFKPYILNSVVLAARPDLVEIMMSSYGADLNAVDMTLPPYYTPFETAVSSDNVQMVRFLIESEADVNLVNSHRSRSPNALFSAKSVEVVRVLLDSGADTTVVNSEGLTAAELARNYDYDEVADLIDNYFRQLPQQGGELLSPQGVRMFFIPLAGNQYLFVYFP